jgi:hypothetical protein
MKCCVCDKTVGNISEYKSINGNKLPYCMDCWYSYRESYDELVNFGWEADYFAKTFKQKTLIPSLQFKNKTIEQFNTDVKKKLEST